MSDIWDLWLLNDYLCVALVFWAWLNCGILNHVHMIILMRQLHGNSLIAHWVTPASQTLSYNNTFLFMTLIRFFTRFKVLMIRFNGYLSLIDSGQRHRIRAMFLQDDLRSSSYTLFTTSATVCSIFRLCLVFVIFYNWGGNWVIGAFFLTIRLLVLELLLLLFEFSIHWISSLSNLVDQLVFVQYFIRMLLVLILAWMNYRLLFLGLHLLIADLNLPILGSELRGVSLKCNCDLFRHLRFRFVSWICPFL